MRCESKGMVRIGQWDEPVRRRSLWARILPEKPALPGTDATQEEFFRALAILDEWRPEAVELCAGREGDDAFVRIERGQPGFLELVNVVEYAIGNLPEKEEAEVERERLKSLVLAFCENKMHKPWRDELAKLFEVKP